LKTHKLANARLKFFGDFTNHLRLFSALAATAETGRCFLHFSYLIGNLNTTPAIL
jgi:hypothetical protein